MAGVQVRQGGTITLKTSCHHNAKDKTTLGRSYQNPRWTQKSCISHHTCSLLPGMNVFHRNSNITSETYAVLVSVCIMVTPTIDINMYDCPGESVQYTDVDV